MAEACGVTLDSANRTVTIYFDNLTSFSFCPSVVREFDGLTWSELHRLNLSPSGEGLSLREKDIDTSIKGLIAHLLGLKLRNEE